MIYVCVQPDITYFHWQIEVMLSSFQQVGVDLEKCHIVLIYESTPSKWSERLKERYSRLNIHLYKDNRDKKHYPPSIKPYGISLLFQYNRELERETMFYHDSDIILLDSIDESKINDKSQWYLSDTISYIGYDYIKSKKVDDIFAFFGIAEEVVKKNQNNSGGAQYIINNTNYHFWKKVYNDSNDLYDFLNEKEKEYRGESYPIQKWCAEMWSTLWNAWLCNVPTIIEKELDFCFATDSLEQLGDKKILHNAGVTGGDRDRMFFKGDYIAEFPNIDEIYHKFDKKMCSYKYAEKIKNIKWI